MVKEPPLRRRDQARAWILITLGVLMFLSGVVLAIHKFTVLDIAPIVVGVGGVMVGIRYLRRKALS